MTVLSTLVNAAPADRVSRTSGLILGLVLGIWTVKKLTIAFIEAVHARNLAKKRQAFREKCSASLKKTRDSVVNSKVSPERRRYIRDLSRHALLEELRLGKVTPSEALVAYQERALGVNADTNCLVLAFHEAEEEARSLEGLTEPKGLLHGLPISLKDDIAVKGYTSAIGAANLLDYTMAEDDCVVVKLLKKQGAVPFVKGNTPQFAFSYESSNPITGTTTHPLDRRRSPGGSSGGDAALTLGGGTLISMGSDIGGSLRCPAAYCGLATLKPTSRRVSQKGIMSNDQAGQQLVWTGIGPMALDVDSVALIMKSLLVPDMYKMDPSIPIMPFQDEVYHSTRPLRVGMYTYDGLFPAVPASIRAVEEAKAALEARGHTVVEWNPPDISKSFELYAKAINADEGRGVADILFGETIDPCLQSFFKLRVSKGWKANLQIFFSKLWDKKYGLMRSNFRILDHISDWWRLTAEIEAYRANFAESFTEAGLDAVISPPVAFPSPVIDKQSFLQTIFACNYLLLYNTLDVPAGVVPVSHVTQEDIDKMADYHPDSANHFINVKMQQDMSTARGLPLGVQCATLRWREELCLRTMKEIELGLIKDTKQLNRAIQ